jgi:hypothetical protein
VHDGFHVEAFRGIAIPNPAQATDFPSKKTVNPCSLARAQAFATSPFVNHQRSLDHCAFFLDIFNNSKAILTDLLLRLAEELHEQTNPCNSGIPSALVWIEFV